MTVGFVAVLRFPLLSVSSVLKLLLIPSCILFSLPSSVAFLLKLSAASVFLLKPVFVLCLFSSQTSVCSLHLALFLGDRCRSGKVGSAAETRRAARVLALGEIVDVDGIFWLIGRIALLSGRTNDELVSSKCTADIVALATLLAVRLSALCYLRFLFGENSHLLVVSDGRLSHMSMSVLSC